MTEVKNNISLIYKFLILVVTTIGLYINFNFISFKTGIVYFTLQSNMLCLLFYIIILMYRIYNKKDLSEKYKNYYSIFKGLIISNIFLTMSVYTALDITNNISAYDSHFIECLFVHYLTPILTIFDYIIFDKKGNMKWFYPLIWGIVPMLYIIFNIIYTKAGGTFVDGKYAYSFLDAGKYGYDGVAFNCIMIFICFITFSYLIVFSDKKAGDSNEKRRIKKI